MSRKNSRSEEEQGAIDLTPMLDVVFIMLIFFIVTASFIKEAGIEVDRPEASASVQKKKAKILIAINAKNEIWIDKKRFDLRNFKQKVERMYAEDPTGTVVIQADDESNLETLSEVTKAARDIGIADVAVATERK